MPTRNVVLTDHQADYVERLVESGRYQNASEVLREGLRLVESQEKEKALRLKVLREAAHDGIADLDEGRFLEFGSVRHLRKHLTEIATVAISEGLSLGVRR